MQCPRFQSRVQLGCLLFRLSQFILTLTGYLSSTAKYENSSMELENLLESKKSSCLMLVVHIFLNQSLKALICSLSCKYIDKVYLLAQHVTECVLSTTFLNSFPLFIRRRRLNPSTSCNHLLVEFTLSQSSSLRWSKYFLIWVISFGYSSSLINWRGYKVYAQITSLNK